MFFIHFQFKVAFRAPFPPRPPLLLASRGCGETFFVPCPKSVSAMNSNGFAANWQNFQCVFAAKVDHKIVAIAFTYTPTFPSPPRLAYNCSNKPKKCKQITTQIVTSTHKSFFPLYEVGRRFNRGRGGGGGATHTPRCLPQFQALPLADVQLTNVKLFLLPRANVIDWPLTVD